MAKNFKRRKSGAGKAIAAIVTSIVMLAGGLAVGFGWGTNWSYRIADENLLTQEELNSDIVIETAETRGVALSAKRIAAVNFAANDVEPEAIAAYELEATVLPEDAMFKEVDYSMSTGAEEYIKINQPEDGGATCTVTILKKPYQKSFYVYCKLRSDNRKSATVKIFDVYASCYADQDVYAPSWNDSFEAEIGISSTNSDRSDIDVFFYVSMDSWLKEQLINKGYQLSSERVYHQIDDTNLTITGEVLHYQIGTDMPGIIDAFASEVVLDQRQQFKKDIISIYCAGHTSDEELNMDDNGSFGDFYVRLYPIYKGKSYPTEMQSFDYIRVHGTYGDIGTYATSIGLNMTEIPL